MLTFNFFLRKCLRSKQYWAAAQSSFVSPRVPPHSLHQPGTFAETKEPTLTYHYHFFAQLTLWFSPGASHSKGSNKCVMKCSHHLITRTGFIALKALCAQLFFSTSPDNHCWQPLSFCYLFFFTFSRIT